MRALAFCLCRLDLLLHPSRKPCSIGSLPPTVGEGANALQPGIVDAHGDQQSDQSTFQWPLALIKSKPTTTHICRYLNWISIECTSIHNRRMLQNWQCTHYPQHSVPRQLAAMCQNSSRTTKLPTIRVRRKRHDTTTRPLSKTACSSTTSRQWPLGKTRSAPPTPPQPIAGGCLLPTERRNLGTQAKHQSTPQCNTKSSLQPAHWRTATTPHAEVAVAKARRQTDILAHAVRHATGWPTIFTLAKKANAGDVATCCYSPRQPGPRQLDSRKNHVWLGKLKCLGMPMRATSLKVRPSSSSMYCRPSAA